jgi:hypothetical protein
MDVSTTIAAVALLVGSLVGVGKLVFMFWREKRRDKKRRPPK